MHIPMVDLKLQHRLLRQEIEAAIRQVLTDGLFIQGPMVQRFEEEVAAFTGVRHAIGVASGTDALRLALQALEIGPGDEVITTPFSFIAGAEAIASVGARPVFVDIDPRTFNLNPELLEGALSDRTRAILPVHLFGQPADLEPMAQFCRCFGLRLIEDCAQSFGARYRERMTGAWGDVGCFSFYPSKNLGGCGDCGMVITGDDDLAEKVRSLGNHGSREKYHHHQIGCNSRLDELQAAILSVKLRHVESFNASRRTNAGSYSARLKGTALNPPVEDGKGTHVFHQYTILADDRDRLREILRNAGIASAIHYPTPLHRQEIFRSGWADRTLPAAEKAAARVLSLPMYPELTEEQIALVCRTLLEAVPR